jgi:hypothetical protein
MTRMSSYYNNKTFHIFAAIFVEDSSTYNGRRLDQARLDPPKGSLDWTIMIGLIGLPALLARRAGLSISDCVLFSSPRSLSIPSYGRACCPSNILSWTNEWMNESINLNIIQHNNMHLMHQHRHRPLLPPLRSHLASCIRLKTSSSDRLSESARYCIWKLGQSHSLPTQRLSPCF